MFGSFLYVVLLILNLAFFYRHGKERRLSIQKVNKKGGNDNQFGSLPLFTFSEESKRALGELFAHFPPGDGNLKDIVGENSGRTDNTRHKASDIFSRPSMTKDEITRKLDTLTSRRENASDLKEVHFSPSPLNFKDLFYMSFVGTMLHCCCSFFCSMCSVALAKV